ncbi:MAG: MBOAT family O-acyltransferase [Pseudomonadota bacterium]
MLFNSAEFILAFLPLTFIVYFWLNHRRLVVAGKSWLVLASLFFYGWWNIAYLPLILVSLLVNFAIGSGLARGEGAVRLTGLGRKPLLWAGIGFNLALLGYYKYADFFLGNLATLGGFEVELQGVVLPLAISFFTFTQIAYLVDSYRGETREYDLLNYALFVTFFPHLIAGPIVHHREIMPQFAAVANLVRRYRNIVLGLFLFSIGLAKKVLIADNLAVWASAGFDQATELNFFEAWFTSLAYTFQLYFDFSGYTDMALGASLLFNIRLPINFDSPYRATSIRDFWRRWHISLSRFLRDYLYIPLGGGRRSPPRVYLNLGVTFLLGGLWHGATWMFVLWGAMHGLAMAVHRAWRDVGLRMPGWLGWLLTFNFVNAAWVVFRAQDLDAALKVYRGMLGLNGIVLPERLASGQVDFSQWLGRLPGDVFVPLAFVAAMILAGWPRNSTGVWMRAGAWNRATQGWAALYGAMACIALLSLFASRYSEFIYFNF